MTADKIASGVYFGGAGLIGGAILGVTVFIVSKLDDIGKSGLPDAATDEKRATEYSDGTVSSLRMGAIAGGLIGAYVGFQLMK